MIWPMGRVVALVVGSLLWFGLAAVIFAQGTVMDGVFTSAQATQGQRTFERVCASCHDTGEFSGGRFQFTWVGLTTADLYETIATLMPEGDPGSLSPQEYAAVVAYLLQLNDYPTGVAPLPTDEMVLQTVEIVSNDQ
jgi:mono/diheme cytochrome c family protein